MVEKIAPLALNARRKLGLTDKVALSIAVILAVPFVPLAIAVSQNPNGDSAIGVAIVPLLGAALFWVPAKLIAAIFRL